MNTKYAIVIGLMVTTLTLVSNVGLASHSKHGGGKCQHCSKGGYAGHPSGLGDKVFHKGHKMLMHKEDLGLSDEQVTQIKEIMRAAKKTRVMQEAEIDVIAIDIKSELYENPVNVDVVHGLIDQKYAIKKDKAKSMVNSFAELKSVLTDAQMDELKSLWKSKS